MVIIFKFNSRSSGQNVPAAKTIAERCGGVIENNFYIIKFDSSDNENLNKLFELVGNLKGSQISIDDGDPVNARTFFYAANCEEKLLCKGVCTHVSFGYYPIERFFEQFSEHIKDGVLAVYNEGMIHKLANFLEPVDENRFKINKQLFLEYFQKETEMEVKFCPKYDFESIKSEVEKLPDEIELISPEEYTERYEPEEFDLEKFIKTVLRNCEIDSKLPLNDILKCSEALTLLLSASNGIEIQNTDVLLYSFPYINKFILLKLKVLEEGDFFEVDEEERTQEEIKDIICKEHDFFCLKNNYMELYFLIFDKDDPKVPDYYNLIKKI
jgi:hypothetical protein